MKLPVVFVGFNRPALAAKTLACIQRYQPEKLFVVLDGPRATHPTDRERCEQMQELIDSAVDWDCDLIRDVSPTNLGCARRVSSGISNAFEQVERAIILEDDLLVDPSFFRFAEHILNRYEDDPRIVGVTGNNFQRGRRRSPGSYRFSKYLFCWGWGTWRRAWELFDFTLTPGHGQTDADVITGYPGAGREVDYWESRFNDVRLGRVDSWAYRWLYSYWKQRAFSVVPEVNLVQNIGFTRDATHTLWDGQGTNENSVPATELSSIEDVDGVIYSEEADRFVFDHVHCPQVVSQTQPQPKAGASGRFSKRLWSIRKYFRSI